MRVSAAKRFGLVSLSLLLQLFLAVVVVEGQDMPPAPPSISGVYDNPNDDGGAIVIRWEPSADDGAGEMDVAGYEILRGESPNNVSEVVGEVVSGATQFVDLSVENGVEYYYRVAAKDSGSRSISGVSQPVIAKWQLFNTGRLNMFIAEIILAGSILYFIRRGQRGEKLFIRRIAGLDAIDDAIGRATEMGKPSLYVPGILDMSDVQTVASMIILGHIAKKVAQYESRIEVPVIDSIVMSTAREVVKEAYLEAGRPDAFEDNMVRYLTNDQFGYVAGVDGIMLRERPAANFYLGAFYAESLILAETGHSVGSIQIAGTAQPSQLPFFIAACDYTLIGEELFAASAYLSREPKLLGSLKGQDVGKALVMAALAIGIVLNLFGIGFVSTLFEVR
jgi:hypothetical protein